MTMFDLHDRCLVTRAVIAATSAASKKPIVPAAAARETNIPRRSQGSPDEHMSHPSPASAAQAKADTNAMRATWLAFSTMVASAMVSTWTMPSPSSMNFLASNHETNGVSKFKRRPVHLPLPSLMARTSRLSSAASSSSVGRWRRYLEAKSCWLSLSTE